jgi:deoxycytidine triphosphate deaminase
MSIQSDRWIRERAVHPRMIEPSNEKQVREGVLSDGLSSNGYDLRVCDAFKIFTHVNSDLIDSKCCGERSFVSVQAPSAIMPPNSFAFAPSIEYFRIPRNVLTICVGQSTYARCGIPSERNAIRAGAGRIRNARNPQHHSPTGQGLRQRRAVPDSVFPLRRGRRDQLRGSQG